MSLLASTAKKKTLEVATEKNIASNIFLALVFIYFFRRIARLMLTKMKKEPRHPQMAPMTIAAGMSYSVFSSSSS